MPFSIKLANYLAKGRFPLKAASDIPLWNELLAAMEVSTAAAKTVVAEAKALQEGKATSVFGNVMFVNGVEINYGGGDLAAFIGAMHANLMTDFDIYNRKGDTTVQDLARRVRKLAKSCGMLKASSIQLMPLHDQHKMGTGLTTKDMLTFLPDPALYGEDAFGSQPDQKVIQGRAPMWGDLKKRRHVGRNTQTVGRKTHYVLAHLLNHQVNGSGRDPANVVPFYADANTEMAKSVEVHLKDLVHHGIPVQYHIQLGDAVGWTDGRKDAYGACTTDEQRRVVQAEQHLPAYLELSLSALDSAGVWQPIVIKQKIWNYVPETVPVI